MAIEGGASAGGHLMCLPVVAIISVLPVGGTAY
jgi:hypothetical protein